MSTFTREILNGKFELLDLIGSGAMGEVYRARELRLGRECVIKRIRPNITNPAIGIRVDREGRAMALLEHPNVVTIYAMEEDADGRPFLVMQLVKGLSLEQLLIEIGGLPRREALHIVRDSLLGVAEAHANGIVHRDLKPGNILIDRLWRVRVTDFGIAQLADTEHRTRMTQVATMMGTPGFMAPEQRKDAVTADARADIYSMGCVLYAIIALRNPSEDFSAELMTDASLLAEFPPAIAAIVMKATKFRREERYQSATEMLVDLEEALVQFPREELPEFPPIPWLTGKEVLSATPTPNPTSVPPLALPEPHVTKFEDAPKKRPLGLALSAIGLAAFAALGWYALRPTEQASEEPPVAEKAVELTAPAPAPTDIPPAQPKPLLDPPRVTSADAALAVATTPPPAKPKAETPKAKAPKAAPVAAPAAPVEPKVERTENVNGSALTVTATVVGMQNPTVKIRYRPVSGSSWNEEDMAPAGGGSYRATISLTGELAAGVAYYIEATTGEVTKRSGRPTAPHTVQRPQ